MASFLSGLTSSLSKERKKTDDASGGNRSIKNIVPNLKRMFGRGKKKTTGASGPSGSTDTAGAYIPDFKRGGKVRGKKGRKVVATLEPGERVLTKRQAKKVSTRDLTIANSGHRSTYSDAMRGKYHKGRRGGRRR